MMWVWLSLKLLGTAGINFWGRLSYRLTLSLLTGAESGKLILVIIMIVDSLLTYTDDCTLDTIMQLATQ